MPARDRRAGAGISGPFAVRRSGTPNHLMRWDIIQMSSAATILVSPVKGDDMRVQPRRFVRLSAVLMLSLLVPLAFASAVSGQAKHARWDIISLVGGGFPGPANAGGVASALAPDNTKITLTGFGTFVAPAGHNGGSGAVTGGGTWQTFDAAGASTGSGTYEVKELVSFVFDNLQSQTPFLIDNIGDTNERANGTAVLRIEYSDGSRGVLTVGCHGPGASAGIFEGIATTKGFKTYYNVQAPAGGVDANRTIFHVSG